MDYSTSSVLPQLIGTSATPKRVIVTEGCQRVILDQNDSGDVSPTFDLHWVVRNSVRFVLANGVLLAVGVGQSILAARLLGPEGKGTLFIVVLTTNAVAQLLGCGLGYSLQYHVGRRSLRESTALTLAIVFAIGVGGNAVLLVTLLGEMAWGLFSVDPIYANLFQRAIPLVSIEMLTQALFPLFIAVDLVKFRNFIEMSRSLLGLLLLTLLVAIAKRGVLGALEGVIISNLISATLLVLVLMRRYGLDLSGARRALLPVLRLGLKQHGSIIMTFILKRADSYLLLSLMGSASVGIYSVAANLAELPLIVARSLQGLILSSASANPKDYASRATARLSRHMIATLLPGYAAYVVVIAWILPMAFGLDFGAGYWPFVILLLATFGLSSYMILGSYLNGSGNPQLLTYIAMLAALCNLVLSVTLIPSLGLIGNAVATCAASTLTFAVTLYCFRQISGRGYRETLLLTRLDWVYIKSWLGHVWERFGLTLAQ